MKPEKGGKKTMCAPVKNLKDLLNERERQRRFGGRRGKTTELLYVCLSVHRSASVGGW